MNANDSVPSASGQLSGHLRSLGPDGLARLVSERGDAVAEPRPRALGELAERLLRPGSVRRAAVRLSLPCLEVAEALAALPAPAPQPLLMLLLGVPAADTCGERAAVALAIERLCALGLVWPAGRGPDSEEAEGGLVMAGALRGLWARPLGLDHPVTGMDALAARVGAQELGPVLGALGVPVEGGEQELRAALLAHHRDGQRVRELVAQAPGHSKRLLEHLARHNTTLFGVMDDSHFGQEWAAERALLARRDHLLGPGGRFSSWGAEMQLPAEVLIALRGPEPAAPFHPRRRGSRS